LDGKAGAVFPCCEQCGFTVYVCRCRGDQRERGGEQWDDAAGLNTDAVLHTSDHTESVSSSDTRPRFWFEQPQCLPTLQTETESTKGVGEFGVIGEERALLIRLKLEEEGRVDKEVVERLIRF
jgi:hypothetical protein